MKRRQIFIERAPRKLPTIRFVGVPSPISTNTMTFALIIATSGSEKVLIVNSKNLGSDKALTKVNALFLKPRAWWL